MDEGENALYVCDPGDYSASLLLMFENGKAARVQLSGFETKTNRKKLTGAYSDKSPLVGFLPVFEDFEAAVYTSDDRCVVFSTALLAPKPTRNTQGVAVVSLKKNRTVTELRRLSETSVKNVSRYRVRSVPAAGAVLKDEDREEQQLSLLTGDENA